MLYFSVLNSHKANIYTILDGLEGDTKIYCHRC